MSNAMSEFDTISAYARTIKNNYERYGIFISRGWCSEIMGSLPGDNAITWSKDWKELCRQIAYDQRRPFVWARVYGEYCRVEMKKLKYLSPVMSVFLLGEGRRELQLYSNKTKWYVRCNKEVFDIWLGHLLTEECQRALTTPRKLMRKQHADIPNAA